MSAVPKTTDAQATQDELEDIILSARYGELEEIQQFVQKFGSQAIADTRDDRGNGCLHMAAANGHNDVISYLLPLFPVESLAATNHSGNTPLHWAAMNGHLETLRILVPALPKSALFLKNQFGRDPLSEAEANSPVTDSENATPQQECAGYLLGFMELEKEHTAKEQEVDETATQGEETKKVETETSIDKGEPPQGPTSTSTEKA